MRRLCTPFLIAALPLLASCAEPTCEDDGYFAAVPDFFTVDSPSGGGIAVEWDLGTVGEVWLQNASGGIIWHIRCNGETEDHIPSCLNSPLDIQDDAPVGSAFVVELGQFQSEVEYHFVVQEHERQCPGQLRGGESDPFTVTVSPI